SHGTLTLNATGSFTYTPTGNYNGTDSFVYRPNDGFTNGNNTTVTLTINPVNDAPQATIDLINIGAEDTTLTVAAPGVLSNDTDVDGDTLTVSGVVTAPTKGTLTINADGSWSYVPNLNTNGFDTFTYRVTDGSLTDTATVLITIIAVNDAPVAN